MTTRRRRPDRRRSRRLRLPRRAVGSAVEARSRALPVGGRVAVALALVVGGALALGLGPAPGPGSTPAGAATTIDAQGVALSPTATCGFGDIDITYAATSVDQQQVSFTAAGGAVLQERTTKAYQPAYQGTEHILANTATPPAPGTVLAVRVVLGSAPPTASTAAEFIVAYRCDGTTNRDGGRNEVVWTCFGDLGACPTTADQALAAAAVPGAVPGAASPPASAYATPRPATAVRASPTFVG